MIHETQTERGLSAGFLASKGEKFSSQLIGQRELTDQQRHAMKTYFRNLDLTRYSYKFKTSMEGIFQKLQGFDDLRQRISSQQISLSEAVAYYIVDSIC